MAVDWWAIGVLMYELLTGSPPFQGANLRGVYKAIVSMPHSRLKSELRKHGISSAVRASLTPPAVRTRRG
jgi:serine/threonine protein kinase